MDERKLTELFRDAVADVPPPSFDERDVATESNRQRVRRRNGIMATSVLGVAVLASGAVLGVALWKGSGTSADTAAAGSVNAPAATGNEKAAPNEVPDEDGAAPRVAEGGGSGQDQSVPPGASKQGDASGGHAAPSGAGGTPSGCGQADLELAAALAGELQAAAPANPAPADLGCPFGSRAAAILLRDDDGRSGMVSVVLTPPGTEVAHPLAGRSASAAMGRATTSDGSQVVVISEPETGSTEPPYATDVQRAADALAVALAGGY